jgi:mono/diheme cytochrome c family protein
MNRGARMRRQGFELVQKAAVFRADFCAEVGQNTGHSVQKEFSTMSLRPRLVLSLLAGVVGAFAVSAFAACSVTPLGATDTGIAQARAKAPPGADAFDRECASCHGKRGEGLTTAPAIIGAGALPTYPRDDNSSSNPAFQANAPTPQDAARVPGMATRGPFRTAQDLYDYVSVRMPQPKNSAGTLKPEEYWAIINFMLIAHGVAVPADGVNATNAKTINIQL